MKTAIAELGASVCSLWACGCKAAGRYLPMLAVMAVVLSFGGVASATETPITPFSISGFIDALGITGTLGTAMEAFARYAAYIVGVLLGMCVFLAVLSWACRPARGRAR